MTQAHALGAQGLGLYRTEFLFLQRNELPDEEEQFQTYRDAALGMSGRPVTIRTLDLGADKADRTGLTLSNEENPALGLRGVRLSLARPKVADTSCAILRASAYGKLRVLVPMVSTREELLAVRRRMLKLTEQLRGEGHMVSDHVPLGAMIEVPAAALALESFIDLVDFLSIGTNDLVQYLLAADRNNEALGEFVFTVAPGRAAAAADGDRDRARHRVPVAVCGEMAGDARMTLPAAGAGPERVQPAPRYVAGGTPRDTRR